MSAVSDPAAVRAAQALQEVEVSLAISRRMTDQLVAMAAQAQANRAILEAALRSSRDSRLKRTQSSLTCSLSESCAKRQCPASNQQSIPQISQLFSTSKDASADDGCTPEPILSNSSLGSLQSISRTQSDGCTCSENSAPADAIGPSPGDLYPAALSNTGMGSCRETRVKDEPLAPGRSPSGPLWRYGATDTIPAFDHSRLRGPGRSSCQATVGERFASPHDFTGSQVPSCFNSTLSPLDVSPFSGAPVQPLRRRSSTVPPTEWSPSGKPAAAAVTALAAPSLPAFPPPTVPPLPAAARPAVRSAPYVAVPIALVPLTRHESLPPAPSLDEGSAGMAGAGPVLRSMPAKTPHQAQSTQSSQLAEAGRASSAGVPSWLEPSQLAALLAGLGHGAGTKLGAVLGTARLQAILHRMQGCLAQQQQQQQQHGEHLEELEAERQQ